MRFTRTLTSSLVVSALALSASPALAQDKRVEADDMSAAVARDLGLSPDQVKLLAEQQERAIALDEQLQKEFGDSLAGTHFDSKSGQLVVNVTDKGLLEPLRGAGAEPRLVAHSLKELGEIKAKLSGDPHESSERQITKAPNAFAGLALDPVTNTVKITATREQADAAKKAASEFGDAVSVELTQAPEAAANWMDGGDAINSSTCSAGFNLRNPSTGARFLLTAGHCVSKGSMLRGQGGVNFGLVNDSWFPTYDDAIARNQNTGYWIQGPWFDSNPSNGAFHSFSGSTDAPVGTVVCKTGITTKWTCGYITLKNEDVTYSAGTVYDMTRHTACVEPGDSGGANLSYIGGKFRAEGVTSGAVMPVGSDGKRHCLAKFGQQNKSWYFPIADSLPYYGAKYGVTLW